MELIELPVAEHGECVLLSAWSDEAKPAVGRGPVSPLLLIWVPTFHERRLIKNLFFLPVYMCSDTHTPAAAVSQLLKTTFDNV